MDHYGRPVPKPAHGSVNLKTPTSSTRLIIEAVTELFDRIVNPDLLIRRMNISANHVISEEELKNKATAEQLDLFADYEAIEKEKQEEAAARQKERKIQEVQLAIKKRFGKNAILRGLNFEEGATAKQRNEQIGGHKA